MGSAGTLRVPRQLGHTPTLRTVVGFRYAVMEPKSTEIASNIATKAGRPCFSSTEMSRKATVAPSPGRRRNGRKLVTDPRCEVANHVPGEDYLLRKSEISKYGTYWVCGQHAALLPTSTVGSTTTFFIRDTALRAVCPLKSPI